jgi:hypothetical protein
VAKCRSVELRGILVGEYRRGKTYSNDMVFFQEARLVAGEEAKNRENECRACA